MRLKKTRTRKLLVPALIGVLATIALPVTRAMADGPAQVPDLTDFHQVAADAAGGFVFMAGGDGIVVAGPSGAPVTTLEQGSGVAGIALDGSTLYAALTSGSNANSIAAIGVPSGGSATFAVSTYTALPGGDIPHSLAVQGGTLWVGYTDGSAAAGSDAGAIGALAGGTFTPGSDDWATAPDLAADPGGGGTLAAVADGTAETFTVQSGTAQPGGSLTPVAAQAPLASCASESQLTVASGGADFYAACDGVVNEYSTSDLTEIGTGNTGSTGDTGSTGYTGNSAAIAADGTLAVGSGSGIGIYPGGNADNGDGETVGLGLGTATLAPGGLAWTGTSLVAITQDGGGYQAQSFAVEPETSAMTLDGPASGQYGKPVALSGSLTLQTGTIAQGTPITVTRTGSTAVTTVTTGPDGSFTFNQPGLPLGRYTYTFRYAGSSLVPAATGTETLTVGKATPTFTVSAPGQVTYKPKIWVTAHLGATYTNRTVAVYAQTVGSARKLLKKGTVNKNGNLLVAYTTSYTTTFTAVFTGDAHYAAKTLAHTVQVAGKTQLKVTGWYASESVGGLTYRLYHHAAHINVDVTVAPNKYGECAWLQVQEYYGGAWHANKNTTCAALSPSSRLAGYLTLTSADLGYHYRVRAHYLPPGTDTRNVGAVTGWQYLLPGR